MLSTSTTLLGKGTKQCRNQEIHQGCRSGQVSWEMISADYGDAYRWNCPILRRSEKLPHESIACYPRPNFGDLR
jgi:hypothetical protein